MSNISEKHPTNKSNVPNSLEHPSTESISDEWLTNRGLRRTNAPNSVEHPFVIGGPQFLKSRKKICTSIENISSSLEKQCAVILLQLFDTGVVLDLGNDETQEFVLNEAVDTNVLDNMGGQTVPRIIEVQRQRIHQSIQDSIEESNGQITVRWPDGSSETHPSIPSELLIDPFFERLYAMARNNPYGAAEAWKDHPYGKKWFLKISWW